MFGEPVIPAHAAALRRKAANLYANLPLSFEQNQGQAVSGVRFLTPSSGLLDFFSRKGKPISCSSGPHPKRRFMVIHAAGGREKDQIWKREESIALRMQLLATSADGRIRVNISLRARSRTTSRPNDPAQWKTGVPHLRASKIHVAFIQVFDLIYYGAPSQLEFDFPN